MKKAFSFLPAVLLFVSFATGEPTAECCQKPLAGITEVEATCSAGGTCRACSNCKYCKNCAKNGGSCSVCK